MVHLAGGVACRAARCLASPGVSDVPTPDEPPVDPAEFWEGRYRERPQIWSGNVNAALADVVAALPAGRALDLGCGEGGDAVWLAERGWQVTAVDISATALERGAAEAERRGLRDRVVWARRDLSAEGVPSGPFELVAATFLHSPVALAREEILRHAAEVVTPGGYLVVIGHAEPPPWAPPQFRQRRLPSATETLEALQLAPGAWEVLCVEHRTRAVTDPDGQPAELIDAIVVVRRG